MTKAEREAELQIYRLRVRLGVHLLLLRLISTVLARSSPTVAQELRAGLQNIRDKTQTIVIPGLKPGYSDLASGENEEAWDEALSVIEKAFKN